MSAIAWTTVKNALFNWVQPKSSLAADHVLWGAQNAPRPSGAFLTMRFRTIKAIGNDWLDVENNPSPTAGAEILLKARGVRLVNMDLTCFAPVGSADAVEAHAILADVLGAVPLDSVSFLLSGAGIGITSIGDIQSLDGVINSTAFDPRAIATVGFFLASEIVETATYIGQVKVDDLTRGTSKLIPTTPL